MLKAQVLWCKPASPFREVGIGDCSVVFGNFDVMNFWPNRAPYRRKLYEAAGTDR